MRRLRLHGLIERLPGTLSYKVTARGLCTALFYTHAYDRIISPGFADFDPAILSAPTHLRTAPLRFNQASQRHSQHFFSQAA